jgi:steroid delta-isomerase-like uncharacterized protein
MTAHRNIDIVNRYNDRVWKEGDLDAIDELLAEDWEHGSPPPGMPSTREGLKQFAGMMHQAIPDMRMTIDDTVAEDDKVVQRWTARGTHKGQFFGASPTGNSVEFSGISIYRLRDGKIVKDWTIPNMLPLLQQIGATPEILQT